MDAILGHHVRTAYSQVADPVCCGECSAHGYGGWLYRKCGIAEPDRGSSYSVSHRPVGGFVVPDGPDRFDAHGGAVGRHGRKEESVYGRADCLCPLLRAVRVLAQGFTG